MSQRRQTLRALVYERLTAAAEEIFALVERTIAEYEEELSRSKEENQRRQQLLEENQRRTQLLDQALKSHGATDEAEQSDDGTALKQEEAEQAQLQGPPAPWEQDQDFSQNLNDGKPGPGIDLEPQDFFYPGQSESGSSDADEELARTDPATEFYQRHEFQHLENPGENGPTGNEKRKGGRPPKQCAICGKIFGDLKRHMVVHTGEKPYSCSVCDKRFTRKGSLQSHMAVHRGDTPFRCSVCGKMFSQRGHLQTHTAMHSGEKPFSCSVCNAQFSSNALLIRHKRVHTGLRLFSCSFCERGFTRNEHLRRHIHTHTGDSRLTPETRD